ncbi:type II toxin-antitoxin system RelE/ParE family toxin [Paenibacillus sonchi]|uniref:Type II toxin-antitoxin system RelE/ParE family toxin n=2 Tax=Paenibacillus sonchi TaxID=373687 RepID=A0A974PGN1_9BACL|nr:type II toxin-antitoxin system RelE/ParE family toxin [Paenibacillus sonchi]QQZ63555.1 type II toxin-antitoxin system RelE/ParE family toxin [Paenibacillus sonchi]
MYEIVFYEDKNGNSDVEQFIDDLTAQAPKNKNARIQLDQMEVALDRLEQLGPLAGYNFVDKLTKDIWEITPGVNRVLLFLWDGNKYVLLSHFRKKTGKTPRSEIKKAELRRKDWLERQAKEE